MASSNDAGEDDRSKRVKKQYMLKTQQCLMLTRENLPSDLYKKFIKVMIEIRKQSADPDGEIRNISPEKCIERVMKLFQGQARVKQGFLNFTRGRSPFHKDADADQLQNPLDFLQRVKKCPYISNDDYNALVQTMLQFSRIRTMTVEDVFYKVKGSSSNCPELLEEFTKNYLPPGLMVLLSEEQSRRSMKTSRVGKAALSFTPDADHSLDGIRVKATNRRKQGNEELSRAEEKEDDKLEPLPDWIPSRLNELPPKVNLSICETCTPSYCLLPENCITLQSSYQTELGRSVLNDAVVSDTSGSEDQDRIKKKTESGIDGDQDRSSETKNKYEEEIFEAENLMFESDVALQRFRTTADFIATLQDRVGSDTRIQEHLTPLHRRCIESLYDVHGLDMLDALLERQNASAALAVLLSRLSQKIKDLSEARLSLNKTCSDIIAENYYKSLDHRSPSFKQLDIKRMSQKALLAEAKEIKKTKLNAGDKYADPDMHEDIRSIISCACASEVKQMMTWTEIVQPFLSINCLWPDIKGSVAPEEACEHCGISKDFLSSIPDPLPANNLALSSKGGEFLRKKSNECSSSQDVFDAEIEEGEFIPDAENIKSDAMLGPGKGPDAAASGDGLSSRCWATDTSVPSTCDHGNESKEQHESRQDSKRTAKPRGMKGGTCCSLVVLCRLYQILYERLVIARNACTPDLYAEFKEKLRRLLDRSIDGSNFEDFCLKFLGLESFRLFTLDMLINRVIKQLFIISSSDQDNSLLRFLDKLRRPILPKNLSQHQNSPTQPSNVLLKHDREEKGREHFSDTGKHFQRRKKRKLDNGTASFSQPGVKDSEFPTHS